MRSCCEIPLKSLNEKQYENLVGKLLLVGFFHDKKIYFFLDTGSLAKVFLCI